MATMSSLASMTPEKAVIVETGESVDVNDVQMSTVLSVKAGEAIPIDGIVVDGKCDVDEKMLTGESYPVAKDIGSTVWAGSINLNGWCSYMASLVFLFRQQSTFPLPSHLFIVSQFSLQAILA